VTRWAIGDIQGCMTSLERLLAAIAFSPARDELWLAGDLVNRGPRSLDVLRWAKQLGVTTVLGNHDLHLLARAAGVAHEKKRDTLGELLAAPDLGALVDWLRAQPLFVHDDRHALVHAGLHPRWTIASTRELAGELETELRGPRWKQFLAQVPGAAPKWEGATGAERVRASLAYLVRVRTCRLDGRVEPDFDGPPEAAPAGCAPWFALPDPAWATHTIVFGHWAAGGLQLGAHHAGLDTGCVWGRSLTAMRLADRHVVTVAAAE
jgi:bis(5'-nucleosyl)-tetraphosphatase (symmetrical)